MTYEKCQNAFRGFIHIEGNYYAYMKGDKMGYRAEISLEMEPKLMNSPFIRSCDGLLDTHNIPQLRYTHMQV